MHEATTNSIEESILQRRRAQRFVCDGKAELVLDGSGSVMLGELRDMSQFGCMVVTHARTPVEAGMDAYLFFSMRSKQYRIASTVRNIRPGRCIGLEFRFQSEGQRLEFNQLFYDIAN